jgi:hypothetical protein
MNEQGDRYEKGQGHKYKQGQMQIPAGGIGASAHHIILLKFF